jgi:hypothetical protein
VLVRGRGGDSELYASKSVLNDVVECQDDVHEYVARCIETLLRGVSY